MIVFGFLSIDALCIPCDDPTNEWVAPKKSGGDMKANKVILMFIAAVVASVMMIASSMAQSPQVKTTFIDLGVWAASVTDRAGIKIPVPSVLYEPATPGEKSHIAILVMHPRKDYLTNPVGSELAKRGYRVLCANSDVVKTQFSRDTTMDGFVGDVGFGVAYLRQYPGVRKVILLGYDSGGALMTAYQNIAENGLKACQGPEKIYKCSPDRLSGLIPADGVMLLDSNWGISAAVLFSINPAIVNEKDGQTLNPELDMYNPANGFNPDGSAYSEEFIQKFLSAEGKRNNRLIQTALDRLTAIDAGKGTYTDNEPFIVPGAAPGSVNLIAQDIRLMSRTRKAWPLLHPDGTISTQVIHSVRVPENQKSLTGSFKSGALQATVREFLNMYAVRVTDDYGYDEDSVHGIDWSSSYSNVPGNIDGVTVPTLVMGMTGDWNFLASETIYENAKSADKTLVFVEGAGPSCDTCKKCEKNPGQFGDTQKTTYDYVDKWLSQKGRFMDVEKP